MSARLRYPFPKATEHDPLKEIVDFGPDESTDAPSAEVNLRISQVMKKLQEIGQRIDKLVSHL